MAIEINKVPFESIKDKRVAIGPRFDFIETHLPFSECYEFDDGGYFIVAPDNTLVPRFVVELKLPRVADQEYYKELSFVLNDNSCGFMWFDTTDFDAQDFTWRLNLPVKLASPLFVWEGNQVAPVESKFQIEALSDENTDKAKKMLVGLPFYNGGQTEESFEHLASQKRVVLLKNAEEEIGTAILTPMGNYTSVSMVIDEQNRKTGMGKKFMQLLGEELGNNGLKAVIGMPADASYSYMGAKSLGMVEVKRGLKCMIASSSF